MKTEVLLHNVKKPSQNMVPSGYLISSVHQGLGKDLLFLQFFGLSSFIFLKKSGFFGGGWECCFSFQNLGEANGILMEIKIKGWERFVAGPD